MGEEEKGGKVEEEEAEEEEEGEEREEASGDLFNISDLKREGLQTQFRVVGRRRGC